MDPIYSSSGSDYEESNSLSGFIVSDHESPPARRKRERECTPEHPTFLKKTKEVADTILRELCVPPDDLLAKQVVGREEEARLIIGMLEVPGKCIRPLLIGPAGIGKMSLIGKTAYLYKETFAKRFPGRRIFCIDCMELFADYNSAERKDLLTDELSKRIELANQKTIRPPILFFKDIDLLYKLEHIRQYLHSLFSKNNQYIASISGSKEDGKIAKVAKFLTPLNFREMTVSALSIEQVCQVTREYLGNANLDVDYEIASIDLAVRLAAKYDTQVPLPRSAINLIQETATSLMVFHPEDNNRFLISAKTVAEFMGRRLKVDPQMLLNANIFRRSGFLESLKEHIVGQDKALEIVTNQVANDKMGLLDPKKPRGVFLFSGPTGVGKTELARQMAALICQDEGAFFKIDCSELVEEQSISKLIGSPPGYVGYSEGGRLTEALRRNPHLVVLLDELEKANKSIWNTFLGVFDGGKLTDGKGVTVDCTKAYFIMTTNLSSDKLIEHLSPEFCNRFTASVPFKPIQHEHIPSVILVQLQRLKRQYLEGPGFILEWSNNVINFFKKMPYKPEFGMRNFCRHLDEIVKTAIRMEAEQKNTNLSGKVVLQVVKGELKACN